jgi:hypothetical protein
MTYEIFPARIKNSQNAKQYEMLYAISKNPSPD